jgi:two-component system sensor histidine kinase KdpD
VRADDVVVIDAPPAESLTGDDGKPLEGNALMAERARLAILREKALLVAAEIVDDQLRLYLRRHNVREMFGLEERILVCISSAPHVVGMLESGRRNADRFRGKLHVVNVRDKRRLSDADQAMLEKNLALAMSLGARVETLDGPDVAAAVIRYAREYGITQIFIGQSARPRSWLPFRRDPTEKILRLADGIDVSLFPVPEEAK